MSARIRHTSAIHGSGFFFQLSPLSHWAACLREFASSRCQRLTSSLHRTADKLLSEFGSFGSAVGEFMRSVTDTPCSSHERKSRGLLLSDGHGKSVLVLQVGEQLSQFADAERD